MWIANAVISSVNLWFDWKLRLYLIIFVSLFNLRIKSLTCKIKFIFAGESYTLYIPVSHLGPYRPGGSIKISARKR